MRRPVGIRIRPRCHLLLGPLLAQSVSLRGARPYPGLGVKPTCRLNGTGLLTLTRIGHPTHNRKRPLGL